MNNLVRFILILFCLLLLPSAGRAQGVDDTLAVERTDTTGRRLGEATVTGTRIAFVHKRDTIIYNMDFFNPREDEMLGDVLRKMPGLEVRAGRLYYHGRAVDRLLVNGVDFKRGDASSALSQLPAYIFKSVKAYEGRTDQSLVTGIDDGVREQVVDVIVGRAYMGTWTGNVTLAGGTDERWLARAFGNTFTDNARVNLFGSATNIGTYQSANDNGDWREGSAGGSAGDASFYRPGAAFMFRTSADKQKKGYFKIDGSADWDFRRRDDYSFSQSEQTLADGSLLSTLSDHRSHSKERLWDARVYLTWRPAKETWIEFGPQYRKRNYDPDAIARSGTWYASVAPFASVGLDSLERHGFDGGWPSAADGTTAAHLFSPSRSGSDEMQHDYSHNLYVTQRLNDRNLRLSYRGKFFYTRKRETRDELSAYSYFGAADASGVAPIYNRHKRGKSLFFNMTNFFDLDIPLRFFKTLRLTYGYQRYRSDTDTQGFRLDSLGGAYADYARSAAQFGHVPEGDVLARVREAEITVRSDQRYTKHIAALYVQRTAGRHLLSLQNTVRFVHDEIRYTKGDTALHPTRDAVEYVLNAKWNVSNDSSFSYRWNYYYEISPQSLSNEIVLPDNADPLHVRLGASALPARRQHSLSLEASRTFRGGEYLSLNGNFTSFLNYLTTRSTLDKRSGVTTTQPDVISGRWSTSLSAQIGGQIGPSRTISYNASITHTFSHTPAYSLGTEGTSVRRLDRSHALTFGGHLFLFVNKFSLIARLEARYVSNTTRITSFVANRFWDNSLSATVDYTLPLDITLGTDATLTQRLGYEAGSIDKHSVLWNVNLRRSFGRAKRFSVRLECSDLLAQRGKQWVTLTTDTRSSGYSNTIGRIFLLHLTYRVGAKNK